MNDEDEFSQYAVKDGEDEFSQYRAPEHMQPKQRQSEQSQGLGRSLLDALQGGGIGLAQGLSDIGANIAQLPGDIYSYATGKESYKSPKPNLRGYIPESNAGMLSGLAGEYAAPFIAPSAGAETLATKFLPKILAGAGIGAAESENRLMGGALGGLGGAIPATAKLLKGSTSKNIVKKLAEDKAAVKGAYKQHYSDLFKEAADKGLKDVSKPKINLKAIEDSGMPKYYKALKQFVENPSLENAHWAQSGLGQLERKLESVAERGGLTPPQNKAYREVQSVKDKIQKAMFSEHKLGSQPDLAKKYSDISAGYKSDVVPWYSAKGMEDFAKGELEAKDLTAQLARNKKFKALLGKKYPELKMNKILRSPWLYTGLLNSAGLGEAYHLYKHLK